MMAARDADRLAIVTGTSSGIGAALAESLLAEGWSVLGLARREVDFRRAGYRHLCLDLGETESLAEACQKELAPILADRPWRRVALVNNAARLGGLCRLTEMTAPHLASVMAVNAVAPLTLLGFVARAVPAATPLRLVNISSGAATMGIPGLADYCASKAALRLGGMSLAAELELEGRDAAVFSYEPGVVETAMQTRARASDPRVFPSHEAFLGFAENGQLATPAAVVAEVIAFLGSPRAAYFVEQRFQ